MTILGGTRARPYLTLFLAAMAWYATGCDGGGREAEESADTGWHFYNHGYRGQRFAALKEIDTTNVAQLKPMCSLQLGEEGTLQTGPVVVGDTMFVTTAHTTVAMNATTCDVIWRHVDGARETDVFPVNRGVAYLDGRLFRGTPDGRLVAMSGADGRTLWAVQAGDPKVGEFTSSAPIAWNGLVFMGLAGSDWGIRGHVMAFDAANGQEKWRFYTIPMGSETGADSWKIPQTAQRGGGGQWTSYALDTKTGELFVPVANPSPDFAPQTRPGDNLFTNSVVVLDAATGKLKWYYQLTPHDGFDWDLGAAPMLFGGNVALGSKDGHLYVLDRDSHEPLFKTPITTISVPPTPPTPEGVRACPGPLGGVEWNGPAYDPERETIFVGSVDWCAKYTTSDTMTYQPGKLYMGTNYSAGGEQATGWLHAVDAGTGKVRWRFHAPAPIVAGVTPTAGGVVFTGDVDGDFYAFASQTGRVLLHTKLPGAVAGGVITYEVNGKQYVATTQGNASRTTFQTTGSPTIVIMALGAPAAPRTLKLPPMTGFRGGASPREHQQEGAAKSAPR